MAYKSKEDVARTLIICANSSLCELCPYKDFDYAVDEIHEITIGDYAGTNREIREGHDLEQMLFSSEFS